MSSSSSNSGSNAGRGNGPLHCTMCGKQIAADARTFPFCSERCRMLDLGNWLDERYVVGGPAPEEMAGATDDSDPPPGRRGGPVH